MSQEIPAMVVTYTTRCIRRHCRAPMRLTMPGVDVTAKGMSVRNAAMPMVMRPREMVVNINVDGQYYVAGELHNEVQLAERLQRAATNNPGNQPVVIRGDERSDWKYIARVMSLCNKAGIRDYRVAVIPPEVAKEGPEL